MKAIILAAWKWTRLRPITLETPKPLIKILWKTILEYNIESIYNQVDEIIIVIKYLWDKIKDYLWDNYKWTKIKYHLQSDKKWTWAAISDIQLNDDILLINWDSIFYKEDIDNLINLDWYWCLVKEVETPEKYWIFKNKNWYAVEIIEKPTEDIWNLANLWVYKFNENIIDISKKIPLSSRWEYEITDSINVFLKSNKFKLITIKGDFIDIWYPEDIKKAEKILENN